VTTEVDVHLSVARNLDKSQQAAEVTIYANGSVIRAEESRKLYASMNLVADKIARQRKYKESVKTRKRMPSQNRTGDGTVVI